MLKRLSAVRGIRPLLFVTGAHLTTTFGNTLGMIEEDGFEIADRIDMLLASDTGEGAALSVGVGTSGFARSFARVRPDLILVLGDRFETLAAVIAAVLVGIPIAHVHGGETTEGAVDELIRHAITKMSHLHFAATEAYAARIVQMGEAPWRVTVSGAPALDNVREIRLLEREELAARLGTPLVDPVIAVTYHSETLAADGGIAGLRAMLRALARHQGTIVFTYPNSDPGYQSIVEEIRVFEQQHPGAIVVQSLGTQGYFSLMKHAAAMIGNSSSGLLEAPSFGLPVVNIGARQAGRIRAANVIDVAPDERAIADGLSRALDPSFRAELVGLTNPYGDGKAAERIVDRLLAVELDSRLLTKRFHDLQQSTAQ